MSWCDKLASTPGVGFRLDGHFAASEAILSNLAPVLDPLYWDDKAHFNITQQSTFDVQLLTDEGYQYIIEPAKIAVTFKHRMRARQVSGGPPIMEMLSHPRPYTELLKDVAKRLVEATLLMPKAKARSIERIGVVSTTAVSEDELPPGIEEFIEYVGKPWKGKLDHYTFNIATEVSEGQEWRDRCIHQIVKSEDREQLMSLNFDFQRILAVGQAVTANALEDGVDRVCKAALRYFEELAEGRRFDAELIKEAAAI